MEDGLKLKLLWFYSPENFANTYVLGQRGSRLALVIDPGVFHEPILNALALQRWEIAHILITRQAQAHVRGLKTILKIFPARIHARAREVHGIRCEEIHPNHPLVLDGIKIGVLPFPELSSDSVMFWIDRMLFTGDVLYAGCLNRGLSGSRIEDLLQALKARLISRAEDLIIYPGEGPPTTLKSEIDSNRWLRRQPPNQRQQPLA